MPFCRSPKSPGQPYLGDWPDDILDGSKHLWGRLEGTVPPHHKHKLLYVVCEVAFVTQLPSSRSRYKYFFHGLTSQCTLYGLISKVIRWNWWPLVRFQAKAQQRYIYTL